jgi:hypothetical protein
VAYRQLLAYFVVLSGNVWLGRQDQQAMSLADTVAFRRVHAQRRSWPAPRIFVI